MLHVCFKLFQCIKRLFKWTGGIASYKQKSDKKLYFLGNIHENRTHFEYVKVYMFNLSLLDQNSKFYS